MSQKSNTRRNPRVARRNPRIKTTQQTEQDFFLGIAKALRTGKELLDSGRDFLGTLMEGAKMLKGSGIGNAIPDIFSVREPPPSPTTMKLETAYGILNVTSETTDEELKSTYRALSRKLHPDKKGGSQELQAMVNTAYVVICKYRKEQKTAKEKKSD